MAKEFLIGFNLILILEIKKKPLLSHIGQVKMGGPYNQVRGWWADPELGGNLEDLHGYVAQIDDFGLVHTA